MIFLSMTTSQIWSLLWIQKVNIQILFPIPTFVFLVAGKVHLWDDLPEDQRPDLGQVAVHAAPNLSLPEVADPVAESLNAGIGKGEKCFYRPQYFRVSVQTSVWSKQRSFWVPGGSQIPRESRRHVQTQSRLLQ